MKKHIINQFIIFIFLLMITIYLFMTNMNRPRILIVHSYNKEYTWVSDIDKGINKYFDKYYYLTRWYYMDTKRHPSDEFVKKSGYKVRQIVEEWKPDILILVDDNAQKVVGVHYVNHPTIKVLYTGLNAKLKVYGYDNASNVRGILERIPFYAFKEILLQILPENKRRIMHISDSSETSDSVHDELDEVDWKPLKFIKTVMVDTYPEWKKYVAEVKSVADVLLVTHYHTIAKVKKNQGILPAKEVLKWTLDNVGVPSIGGWGFFVEDGGMMSVAVSPFEQGEFVAKASVQILENDVNIKNIRSETNYFYLLYINKKEFEKYKISLPSIYESFARATNTYYE